MELANHLEATRTVIRGLDTMLESSIEDRPSVLCDKVEAYLLRQLNTLILNYLSNIANEQNESFVIMGQDGFAFGDEIYIVEFSRRKTTLSIDIRSIDTTSGKVSRRVKRIGFSSPGQYTEIRLYTALKFEKYQEELCEIGVTLLQNGYRWLEQQVLTILGRFRDDIAEELYLLIRKNLPDLVTDYLWFFVIVGASGFYLPDRHSLEVGLQRTKRRIILGPDSPLKLISQFTDVELSFDDTSSKDAIESDKIIAQDFQKARYAATGFQIAEEAVYNCRGIWVHPLVREGKALLTVGYPAHPADLREKVYIVCESLKPQFKQVLERNSKLLRSLLEDIKRQHILPGGVGDIAYIAGRFLQGLGNFPSMS